MEAIPASPEVLLARQPICTASLATVGYELLFRDANVSIADIDGTTATSNVLVGAVADIGLDELVGAHKAWLNIGSAFLRRFDTLPLPPRRVVLEILETVDASPDLLERLWSLRDQGFTLAADDFTFSAGRDELLGLIDIVKLDVRALGLDAVAEHVTLLQQHRVEIVAEKVETPEEFAACRDAGCTLFQGWFHCRPSPIMGIRIPTRGPAGLPAIADLAAAEIGLDRLQEIVTLDVGLSMRLLRLMNSAGMRGRHEITTVHQALALLGERQARQWLMLVLLADLAPAGHPLLETAIVRGRACELLAGTRTPGVAPADAFTAGLFSVADALTASPMSVALERLPLGAPIKAALLEGTGPLGTTLRQVRDYERETTLPAVDFGHVAGAYTRASAWAASLLRGVAAA